MHIMTAAQVLLLVQGILKINHSEKMAADLKLVYVSTGKQPRLDAQYRKSSIYSLMPAIIKHDPFCFC